MNTIIGVGVVAVNISILYLHQSTRTICSCYVCSGKDGLENIVGKISFNQHNLSHILESLKIDINCDYSHDQETIPEQI